MNILLIQREGTDLHHTLFASETSRLALRFYHPRKVPSGVYITVATLGSALSLVSELRWYIRRYVRETLFEVEKDSAPRPLHRMFTTSGPRYSEKRGHSAVSTVFLAANWPARS